MKDDMRIALIGLDTSHSVEFTRVIQAPDCPADLKVDGLKVVSCMRFSTPFQDNEGLDRRQAQLEEWGVEVTTDFDRAIRDCDAIMFEINDPSLHEEYFMRSVDQGKPLFIDKPLADSVANGIKIANIARKKAIRVFSASSLRFSPALEDACTTVPLPSYATVYGHLGTAPAGSSIVWYGVHTFEMLERIMGCGSLGVFARRDPSGVSVVVEYPGARRGIVELTEKANLYGGCLRDEQRAASFFVDNELLYTVQLSHVASFFHGEKPPVAMEETLEIQALMDATDRSLSTGQSVPVKA